MPVRGESRQGAERVVKKKLDTLMISAGKYAHINEQIKELKKEQDSLKVTIKELINDPEIHNLNGKHKERVLPLGDGKHELFVQLQIAEQVNPIDNIIEVLRDKLGDKVEPFIIKTEILQDNALEGLYNQKVLSQPEILDLVNTKETERLIIKVNEVKK